MLQRKNFLFKYYAQVLSQTDFLLFCQVSLEFIESRRLFLFPNSIKNIFVVNSCLRKYFMEKQNLYLLAQGGTAIITFQTFHNLQCYLETFFFQLLQQKTEFLPLMLYWTSRNRLISLHYLRSVLACENFLKLENILYYAVSCYYGLFKFLLCCYYWHVYFCFKFCLQQFSNIKV